ncbi:MAG: response regulator [Campylobacterales bacterium]|nr:response regulator [Campylobacterales bacterium]
MLHVMIVDDSVTVRRMMKNVLTRLIRSEMVFIEAGTGIEALAELSSHPEIKLVMLDVNMPEMNGDIFLEKMRANSDYNHIRVVMATTEAEKRTVMRIMKLGANGYIIKPFTPQAMRKSLEPILARMGIPMVEEKSL